MRTRHVEHFIPLTRQVFTTPYDPALAGGGPIIPARLSQGTRDKSLQICAAVADGL